MRRIGPFARSRIDYTRGIASNGRTEPGAPTATLMANGAAFKRGAIGPPSDRTAQRLDSLTFRAARRESAEW